MKIPMNGSKWTIRQWNGWELWVPPWLGKPPNIYINPSYSTYKPTSQTIWEAPWRSSFRFNSLSGILKERRRSNWTSLCFSLFFNILKSYSDKLWYMCRLTMFHIRFTYFFTHIRPIKAGIFGIALDSLGQASLRIGAAVPWASGFYNHRGTISHLMQVTPGLHPQAYPNHLNFNATIISMSRNFYHSQMRTMVLEYESQHLPKQNHPVL